MSLKKSYKNVSLFCARHEISKTFFIDENGEFAKKSGGQIWDAQCYVFHVSGPQNLAEQLNNLNPRQCMAWGVLTEGRVSARIVPKGKVKKNEVSRTRDNFEYPSGSAIMMLDIDDVIPVDELLSALTSVMPSLVDAPYVLSHSASTYIYNGKDETCFKGEGGKRVYIFVAEGSDIPRAAKVLGSRLKLAGHFSFKVSKSGQLMERTLIDEAVYQPERLDFCGGAECMPPLVQRRPSALAFNDNAGPVDTRIVLPDLTAEERARLEQMRTEKREAIKEESEKVREQFAAEQATEIVSSMGKKGIVRDQEQIKAEIMQSIQENVLVDDMILYPETGGEVTVGEVRRNPLKWHKKRFADPVDPTYNNDKRIAMAMMRGAEPHINSFAHGGQTYRFETRTVRFPVDQGDYPRIVEECSKLLAEDGRVFQRGGELVRLSDSDSTVLAVTAPWLRNKLEKLCIFTKIIKDLPVRTQCPPEIAERILASRGAWPMPVLKGVTNLPFMRLDGSIVHRFGYDERTKVYLTSDCEIPLDDIQKPKRTKIKKALKLLCSPFGMFPFSEAMDRGVLLSAMLTSAVRASLPTAPAFFVGAPVFGSGKTLLAQTVAATTGRRACVMAWPDTDAERRKALVSVLRNNPENIILDNLVGTWNSVDLAAILTAEEYSDRVLGASEMIEVQTKCLVLATGNNVSVSGDLARRVLTMTLNSHEERPDQRRFSFNPLDVVNADLLGFRCAALTVLKGCLNAKNWRPVPGGMGSFEDWERLVRQAVCWVAAEGLAPFELDDPLLSINKNFEGDNETNRLKILLAHWHSLADRPLTLKDLVTLAEEDRTAKMRNNEPLGDDESFDCLYDILYEIAGRGNEINNRILSAWMRKNLDRPVDGMSIIQSGKVKKIARWAVNFKCEN